MKTKERIKRYGEAAYKKMLQQGCDWNIDVIKILEGGITLLTEKEIAKGGI